MTKLRYETKGGNVTEAETFAQLIEHLRLAQEAAYTLGHLNRANGHTNRGNGFLQIGEAFGKAVQNCTALATKCLN